MTFSRGLAAVVVRVATLAVLHVAFLAVLSRVDTSDPLGPGLLFFLIVFVGTLIWAGLDALRRGFVVSSALWAVTAVAAGFALTVVFVVTTSDADFSEEWAGSTLFFALLVLVPALIGSAAGGLVHRIASSRRSSSPEPSHDEKAI